MSTKRFLLAAIALALLLPFTGCHRHCCGDNRSFAPPPSQCCPPAGAAPTVLPAP